MEELDLVRISTHPQVGTFGVLKWVNDRAPFALSLEDPWLDNKLNVSCIPDGIYICQPFPSPTHGHTFQVMDVSGGRTYILFHRGNTHINTQGCILIGEKFHFLQGIPSIAASADGFKEFWEHASALDEFRLIIRWAA